MLARVRLFINPHAASCSNCGLVIRERIRRPCPRCGDTRRTLSRALVEAVKNEDNVS